MINVPYTPQGFVDVAAVDKLTAATPFVIMIGVRQGAGKTYGIFTEFIMSNKHPVIVRRTKSEREKFGNAALTPLQRIPAIDSQVIGVNNKDLTDLYYRDVDGNPDYDRRFGWVIDLGTAKKRGFSIVGFDAIFFDECIPEINAGGKNDIKAAEGFQNLLITLLSNDYPDVASHPKCWVVGNSDSIINGIFMVFGITGIVERMIREGKQVYINPQRCVSVILVNAEANTAKRSKMPVSRAFAGSRVNEMALHNDFNYDSSGVKPCNLREFSALASFRGKYSSYTIWRHKCPATPILYVTRGAYPAHYNMVNNKESFVNLGRETAFGSFRGFWYLTLHAISGKNTFYDSIESKEWFKNNTK